MTEEKKTEPTIITPTVGRMVNFYCSPDDRYPQAAIVAWVHHERLVNLAVIDSDGSIVPKGSVLLRQPGDAVPADGVCAEWMPYQLGQAIKNDGEVAELRKNIANLAKAAAEDVQAVANHGNLVSAQIEELAQQVARLQEQLASPSIGAAQPKAEPPIGVGAVVELRTIIGELQQVMTVSRLRDDGIAELLWSEPKVGIMRDSAPIATLRVLQAGPAQPKPQPAAPLHDNETRPIGELMADAARKRAKDQSDYLRGLSYLSFGEALYHLRRGKTVTRAAGGPRYTFQQTLRWQAEFADAGGIVYSLTAKDLLADDWMVLS